MKKNLTFSGFFLNWNETYCFCKGSSDMDKRSCYYFTTLCCTMKNISKYTIFICFSLNISTQTCILRNFSPFLLPLDLIIIFCCLKNCFNIGYIMQKVNNNKSQRKKNRQTKIQKSLQK